MNKFFLGLFFLPCLVFSQLHGITVTFKCSDMSGDLYWIETTWSELVRSGPYVVRVGGSETFHLALGAFRTLELDPEDSIQIFTYIRANANPAHVVYTAVSLGKKFRAGDLKGDSPHKVILVNKDNFQHS